MTKILNSTRLRIGAAYSALAIATMISPIFVGIIADRLRTFIFPRSEFLEIVSFTNQELNKIFL